MLELVTVWQQSFPKTVVSVPLRLVKLHRVLFGAERVHRHRRNHLIWYLGRAHELEGRKVRKRGVTMRCHEMTHGGYAEQENDNKNKVQQQIRKQCVPNEARLRVPSRPADSCS